jgi:hypothetical protein
MPIADDASVSALPTTNPMTELEAINVMLGAIFEMPVNTLDGGHVDDVSIARRILAQTARTVLVKGLANNIERNVVLQPDATTNKIPLPANTLFVDSEPSDGTDVVQRGPFLYDRSNHTFVFDGPVTCKVYYNLAWDDLPEYVKNPLVVMAARKFQKTTYQGEDKGVYTAQDEADARDTLGMNDADSEDLNMFTDSWSVYSILDR